MIHEILTWPWLFLQGRCRLQWRRCRYAFVITKWKVSVFEVFLVRVFSHLYWIWKDTIQSECEKIRTRKTLNADNIHAVFFFLVCSIFLSLFSKREFETMIKLDLKITSVNHFFGVKAFCLRNLTNIFYCALFYSSSSLQFLV